MPQRPRRPGTWSSFLALLLLVLAPAALHTGSRPASGEPAGTAVANALGPSYESALVVEVAGALRARDGGRSRIPPGPLLVLAGGLSLLSCLRPPARPNGGSFIPGARRSLPPPAPASPRAPPDPRLV